MPVKLWQKMIFALITVVITVHLFVFYNLYVVNGLTVELLETYGVPIFGSSCPVWALVIIEFVCAFLLEMLLGSPLSMKLAFKVVDPAKDPHFMVETAIICATVGIMCPAMSFLAVLFYNDLSALNFFSFNAVWLKTIMYNLPVAFFGQLLFIQPLVRAIFAQLSKLWNKSYNVH